MKKLLIFFIRLYQRTLSPDHGPFSASSGRCRYFPSCSEYTAQAIEKHGIVKGTGYGLARIAKCNPLFTGGTDPIK